MKIFHTNRNNNNPASNTDIQGKVKRERNDRSDSKAKETSHCPAGNSTSTDRMQASDRYSQLKQFRRRHRCRAAILRKIYKHYLSGKTRKRGRKRNNEGGRSKNHSKREKVQKKSRTRGGQKKMPKESRSQFSRTNLSAGATASSNNQNKESATKSGSSMINRKKPIWFITGGSGTAKETQQ